MLEQPGLYKGTIKDFAVTQTSHAKLPQFVATFLATERFDESADEWIAWDYEDQTLIGYLVLVSLDKHGQVAKCWSYEQVMEAVGWDGETYSGLAAMDLKGKVVKFQVAEDTYDGQTRMKVKQLYAEDGETGLRKLSQEDLAALDSKFKVASSKPKTAATAKPKPKPKAKKAPPKAPTAEPSSKEGPETRPVTPCTMDEAYEACLDANEALGKTAVPEKVLDDYWTTNRDKIAADTDNITLEEWGKIKNATLEDIKIPF